MKFVDIVGALAVLLVSSPFPYSNFPVLVSVAAQQQQRGGGGEGRGGGEPLKGQQQQPHRALQQGGGKGGGGGKRGRIKAKGNPKSRGEGKGREAWIDLSEVDDVLDSQVRLRHRRGSPAPKPLI